MCTLGLGQAVFIRGGYRMVEGPTCARLKRFRKALPHSTTKDSVPCPRSAAREHKIIRTRHCKQMQFLNCHPHQRKRWSVGWPKHVRAYGGWLGSEELMKDVAACDKPRGGGKQPLIRGFPNGVTQRDEVALSYAESIGIVKGT